MNDKNEIDPHTGHPMGSIRQLPRVDRIYVEEDKLWSKEIIWRTVCAIVFLVAFCAILAFIRRTTQ